MLKIIIVNFYTINKLLFFSYRKNSFKGTSTSKMAKLRSAAIKLSAKLRPTKKPGFLPLPKQAPT